MSDFFDDAGEYYANKDYSERENIYKKSEKERAETLYDRMAKTPERLARTLADSGAYCTHYPGYTCDKDWPRVCYDCILRALKRPAPAK